MIPNDRAQPRAPRRPRPWVSIAAMIAVGLSSAHAAAANGPDAALYAEVLSHYTREVSDLAGTRVDYQGLLREPKWRQLLSQLEAANPDALETRDAKLAFWINAYNILAIQTVLDGYPTGSIRDLGSFFSPVWKRNAGRIGGEVVTLHEIEHEILRPMGEPRMHAAIVCASTSCPSLSRTPFHADTLDAELTAAFRRFLADPGKGMKIDRATKKLYLSAIFDWFEDDWDAQGGVVRAIAKAAPDADQSWLRDNAASLRIETLPYDWRLNDTTPPDRRR